MAPQTPEGKGATAPVVQAQRPLLELPSSCIFHPDGACLLKRYLLPMARVGRVPDQPPDFVADGVDVHAVRPEALPFPSCNKGLHDKVWDYYFTTTRPAAAAGGSGSGVVGGGSSSSESEDDDDDGVRVVAAGGCWRRYGAEKEYVGDDDGEVYGFRRRFAFHEAGDPGKKTAWRMKEFRLNEAAPAPALRGGGGVFNPSAKGLVIWKVYNEVIPEEEPAVDYYNINGGDDEEEEIGLVVITVGDDAAAASAP